MIKKTKFNFSINKWTPVLAVLVDQYLKAEALYLGSLINLLKDPIIYLRSLRYDYFGINVVTVYDHFLLMLSVFRRMSFH